MRGAPAPGGFQLRLGRIIPADAGSTTGRSCRSSGRRDHPRGCGEHAFHHQGLAASGGSSPRMRGAPDDMRKKLQDTRIIPADAGSTISRQAVPLRPRDHPRGCGEHRLGRLTYDGSGGSSPRMRGALLISFCTLFWMGIIPADAGSTQECIPDYVIRGDHPRGCREH